MNRKIFAIIGLIILSLLLFGAGIWVGQTPVSSTSTKGQCSSPANLHSWLKTSRA